MPLPLVSCHVRASALAMARPAPRFAYHVVPRACPTTRRDVGDDPGSQWRLDVPLPRLFPLAAADETARARLLQLQVRCAKAFPVLSTVSTCSHGYHRPELRLILLSLPVCLSGT
jgi:hypothetical protein